MCSVKSAQRRRDPLLHPSDGGMFILFDFMTDSLQDNWARGTDLRENFLEL